MIKKLIPTIGVTARLPVEEVDAIDTWREGLSLPLTRSQAIRALIMFGIAAQKAKEKK